MTTWWCYALSYDESVTREEMTAALDRIESVGNWYACLPNTIFVVSSVPAAELALLIKRQSRARQFILLDVDTDRNGALPKKAWEFMSNPKPVRKK
jgi:hypothetical protein